MINKYLYVVVIQHPGHYTGFKHTYVEAKDRDDAYHAGHRWLDETLAGKEVTFLNDYVIPVESCSKCRKTESELANLRNNIEMIGARAFQRLTVEERDSTKVGKQK